MNLSESETKRYSDYEIEILIDDLTEAALEAIEQAAGEAAKAAVMAMLEREAEVLREAQRWRLQAELNAQELTRVKKDSKKNVLIAVLISVFSGLAVGIGGTLIIGSR